MGGACDVCDGRASSGYEVEGQDPVTPQYCSKCFPAPKGEENTFEPKAKKSTAELDPDDVTVMD